MKKILLTLFVVLLGITLSYGFAYALAGVCSNCHTMHNSQNGADENGSGPFDQLLRDSCVGCHTAGAADYIGTAPLSAPKVLSSGVPSLMNAGGDFYYVNLNEVTNTAKGHNVTDLPNVSAQDALMPGWDPPGWDPAVANITFGTPARTLQPAGGSAWTTGITCAGRNGCHGYQDVSTSALGIQGAHHSNTGGSATQASAPTTMGGSYRFLAKVRGLEDTDWEGGSVSSLDHNSYYGQDYDTVRRSDDQGTNYGTQDTMSWLCAKCHGEFHTKITLQSSNAAAPWARHPTDIELWQAGETTAYTNYDPAIPVARDTVPSTSSATISQTNSIVMCLSCHRAHGSAEDDLLRFNYSAQISGDSNTTGGCVACHTTKD